jgi:hypothetical protein
VQLTSTCRSQPPSRKISWPLDVGIAHRAGLTQERIQRSLAVRLFLVVHDERLIRIHYVKSTAVVTSYMFWRDNQKQSGNPNLNCYTIGVEILTPIVITHVACPKLGVSENRHERQASHLSLVKSAQIMLNTKANV